MRQRRRARRFVSWSAALLAVCILAAIIWSWWRQERVNEQLVQRKTSLAEIVPAIPKEDNGAAAYYAAKRLFEDAAPLLANPEGDARKALNAATACPCEQDGDDPGGDVHPEVLAAVARFMAETEDAYAAVIEAQTFPATQFHDYETVDMFANPIALSDAFTVIPRSTRYLDLRARWHLLHGEHDEAMQWALRVVQAANAMSNETSLIALLTRNAVASTGINLLQDVLCSAGNITIPTELRRELTLLANRETVARFIEGEAALMTIGFRTMRARGQWTTISAVGLGEVEMLEDLDTFAKALAVEETVQRHEMYDAARQRGEAREGDWFVRMADISFPALVRGVESTERTLAQLAIARTALHLESYWNDHNAFPGTLSELVPDYVEALPEDPFLGGELRYEKTPDGYRLASAGVAAGGGGPSAFRGRGRPATSRHFAEIAWCITRPAASE